MDSRSHQTPGSNILDELIVDPSEEEEKLVKKFSRVKVNDICTKLKEQGLVVSDLTLSKYKHLFHANSKGLVPVFPRISIPIVEADEKPIHAFYQAKPINKSQFLSTKDLIHLKKGIINHIEEQHLENTFFRNKSQHSFNNRSRNSSVEIDTKSSQFSKLINYARIDEVFFQLNHNKGQLQQVNEEQERIVSEHVAHVPLKKRKGPQIKSYPSKPLEDLSEQSTHKKEQQQLITLDIVPTHHVVWFDRESSKWRPPMREGHTLTAANRKFFCYGGVSNKKHSELVCYDPSVQMWRKVDGFGDKATFGRNNHSAACFKKTIYYFGGEKSYDQNHKVRECLSDIRSLNTENLEWRSFKPLGDNIEARRGHQATFVGKNMVIIGGITTRGNYCNDVYHLDIMLQKLSLTQVQPHQFFPDGLAFHSATAVYNFDKQPMLYKAQPVEESVDKQEQSLKPQWIKQEGIYVFGGEGLNGGYYGGLSVLNTSQRPMVWVKPDCKGAGPCARIRHTALYHESLNIYIVHGGIDAESRFLADVHILRVDSLNWLHVEVGGQLQVPRAGHDAAIDQKQMIVFGGYNEQGYVNGDLQCLELDSRVAVRIKRQTTIQETQEHDREIQTVTTNANKRDHDRHHLDELHSQVERLNYNNLHSFLPMPQKTKLHDGFQRMNKQQIKQIESIRQETDHFVQAELNQLKADTKPLIRRQTRILTKLVNNTPGGSPSSKRRYHSQEEK